MQVHVKKGSPLRPLQWLLLIITLGWAGTAVCDPPAWLSWMYGSMWAAVLIAMLVAWRILRRRDIAKAEEELRWLGCVPIRTITLKEAKKMYPGRR